MKSKLFKMIPFFLLASSYSFGFTNPPSREINAKQSKFEFSNLVQKNARSLLAANKELVTTSKKLPQSTSEAYDLLYKACLPKDSDTNSKIAKITYKNMLTRTEFICETNLQDSNRIEATQILVVTDQQNTLHDLQINQIQMAMKDLLINSDSTAENREVIMSIVASSLISGEAAKTFYAGEDDKFLHSVGGNLISVSTALLGYYQLDLSPRQAALLGFISTTAIGLLKEYLYDASHQDIHTVDINDAVATSMGGSVGTVAALARSSMGMKFKFVF